jgi:hypothetical protein
VNSLRYLSFARRGFVRAGPPIHLTLFITGQCNLRCRHCFHWKEVAAGVLACGCRSLPTEFHCQSETDCVHSGLAGACGGDRRCGPGRRIEGHGDGRSRAGAGNK